MRTFVGSSGTKFKYFRCPLMTNKLYTLQPDLQIKRVSNGLLHIIYVTPNIFSHTASGGYKVSVLKSPILLGRNKEQIPERKILEYTPFSVSNSLFLSLNYSHNLRFIHVSGSTCVCDSNMTVLFHRGNSHGKGQ
jgi:hypothetical protein